MPAIVGDASAAGVNGTNQLTWASAYNAALGVYTGNLTFQVKGFSGYNVTDNSTPIIAFIDPTQSMNLSATSRNINFTVNGTGTQVSYVTLVVDSMPALIYNATTGAQGLNCTAATPGSEKLACNATVNLTNGTHTLTVTAYDYGGTAGNIKISAITFTTDTTAPTITINNPNTDPAQSKTLTASTSDGTLTMNITTGSACNSSLTFAAYAITTFTSESDNGKKICYKAVDAASNTAYSMSSAISGIDATAPVVSLISPNNSITWASSTSPVHHFNVSDSISSTFNCTVFLTGSVINASYNRADVANSSSDGDIDFGFWYGLNNGNVTWHVNCTDAVGNTGTSASRWYYVNDTTAPDITDSSYSCTMSGSECTSSTTSVGISVTTDEDATCKYDTEDVVYDDMADLFTTTGGTTHEETYEVDDGEDYLIYVRCEDDYSNQNDASTEISFSVKKKSSGAGGGSSAPPNPSTTMGWSQMAPGTTSIMRITNEELGLTKIIIEVNSPTQNVKIIIEKLPGKPATITKIITGKVFNYLKITKLNLDDALISGNAKVQFKIPLSWLTSNGVDPKNIALKRFADNDWQDLKTTLLSTDSKYAYYESETPGFSYFAIGEKSAELTPVPKPAEEPATTTTTETGTGAATTTPEKKPATTQPEKQPAAATTTTKSKPAVQVTIVVIVVIAIGLIILTSTGRKKKGLRHIDEING
jgi:PGF-pre-PGF domain-containing protein